MSTRIIEISSTDDTIDVRDVIARVEELEDQKTDADTCLCGESKGEHTEDGDGCNEYEEDTGLDEDETKELSTLTELLDDLRGNGGDEQWRGDWYPVTLVRDSYFTDFAQEEAESCGLVDDNARWPATCIDWERAASELQSDYSTVEFEGITFWYR
jgi:hypothetical protein